MATFEVFVPVQGEVIFTIEADNHGEAQYNALEMDFSEGELNIEWNDRDEMRSEILSDDDDDDDDDDDYSPVGHAIDRANSCTVMEGTGRLYRMRHFRV